MHFSAIHFCIIYFISFLAVSTIKAQEVPNEVFWFSPLTLTPNEAGNIDLWVSNNGEVTAIQSDAGKQPSYNSNLLNGMPGLELNGSQFLELSGTINFTGGDKTIFLFYRPDELSYGVLAKGNSFAGNGASDGDFGIYPISANFRVRWREFDQFIDLVTPNLTQNNFYFVRIEINRESGQASLYINEQLKDFSAISQSYTGSSVERVTQLGSINSVASLMLNGAISDVGLFSFADNQKQLDEILIELGNRYLPPINLGDDILLTPGSSCTYTLSIDDNYDSIIWSTGETAPSISITEPGEYYVVATGDYGFKVSDTINIGFDENLLNSNYLLCSYDSLEWDLGLTDGYTYSWSDGLETTESVRYLKPDNSYSVTISNGNCSITTPIVSIASDSYSETVNLISTPTFCLGNELYLSSGFAEAVTYTWSTGSTSPFITPQSSGTYWVEATNANGCVGSDTVEVVMAGTAPTVAFATGTACAGNAVAFTDETFNEGSTITGQHWTFGTHTAEGAVVDQTYEQPGKYPVELMVSLANGCTGTGRDTVTVNPLPMVNFNYDEVIPCAGNPVAFQSQSAVPNNQTIASYFWKFGNQTTATGIVGTTTFNDLGPNTVTHIVTTTPGCKDSLTAPVIVLGSPEVNFTFDTVCTGLPTTFQEQVNTAQSGGVFYHWDFGDGYYSNFPNTAHNFAAPGTYNVTLTATGNDFGNPGCTHALTRQVSIFAPPTPAIATSDACLGSPITLTDITAPATQGGITDYITTRTWTLPYGYGQGPVSLGHDSIQHYTPTAVNNYAVQFNFQTAAGCTGSASANVGVSPIPTAHFEIHIPPAAPPTTATPQNLSTHAQTYDWYLNNTWVSSAFEPAIALPDTGTYTLTLIATHSNACGDTISKQFTVIDPLYDIGILDIRHSFSGHKLNLRALLTNNGNIPITRFNMNLKLGVHITIDQHFDFEIQPGEVVEFTLPQMFDFSPIRDQPFVCMEVGLRTMGIHTDADPANNYLCKSLDSEKPHFLPPYPNPADGVLHLGFILPFSGAVDIALHDASGHLLDSFTLPLTGGYHVLPYNTAHLAQGSYILHYQFGGITTTQRIAVVR